MHYYTVLVFFFLAYFILYNRLQPHSMWDISSLTRVWTHMPCIARQTLNHCATWEVLQIDIFIYLSGIFYFVRDCWLSTQYPLSSSSPLMGFQFCWQHPCAQKEKRKHRTYISYLPWRLGWSWDRTGQCHGNGICCCLPEKLQNRKFNSVDKVIFELCSCPFFLL